jgi:Protein of unknown function (DUF2568)
MALTVLKNINLGLAFFVEMGALAALCYWGFAVGPNTLLKIVLGLGAPALAIVVWAFFGAPKSSMQLQGVAYLALQAAVFGAGALALVASGQRGLGVAYAIIAFVNSAAAAIWRQ